MKIKVIFASILTASAIMVSTASASAGVLYGAQTTEYGIRYLSSNGRWVSDCIYGVGAEKSHGLLEPGYWRFDENGYVVLDNGLREDPDGATRYYVDGVATYAGLVVGDDGYLYYINSEKKAVKNCTYSIGEAKCNGIFPAGTYCFDEEGRMYVKIPIRAWDDVINDRFYIRYD